MLTVSGTHSLSGTIMTEISLSAMGPILRSAVLRAGTTTLNDKTRLWVFEAVQRFTYIDLCSVCAGQLFSLGSEQLLSHRTTVHTRLAGLPVPCALYDLFKRV